MSDPLQTGICARLGIAFPILQAPMNWATDARLVAAVSNGGGLGILGPNAGAREPVADVAATGERLRSQIVAVRAATSLPFAVNVPIGRGAGRAYSDRAIEIVIEETVPVVAVATGSPEVYTRRLKDAGITVIHAVSSVYHAEKAEAAGVDLVVAEGFDGGGHSGFAETPTFVLVPQVVQRIAIPVVAAGGIVDGRGLAMAVIAGAQGVYMGTRFMACVEAPIHDRVKQAIVDANDSATMSWGRSTEVARTLANDFAKQYRKLELSGATPDELHRYVAAYETAPNRRVGGLLNGDLEQGEIYLGSGAGLIHDILPAAQIIERTMEQARAILAAPARTATSAS